MRRDKWHSRVLLVCVVIGGIVWGVGIYQHDDSLKFGGIGLGILGQWIIMWMSPRDPERRMQIQLRVPGLSDDRSTWPSGECDLVLQSAGRNPIDVVRALKRIYLVDINDADEIVNSAPKTLKEGISFAEAEFVKTGLEAAGAQVDIHRHV